MRLGFDGAVHVRTQRDLRATFVTTAAYSRFLRRLCFSIATLNLSARSLMPAVPLVMHAKYTISTASLYSCARASQRRIAHELNTSLANVRPRVRRRWRTASRPDERAP